MSIPTASSLIDLNGVTKAYKTDAGLFLALKGIDLQVNAGEFVAIVGKSGSGKTTLINMITGLDRPTEGEIIVDDHILVDRLVNEAQAIPGVAGAEAWGFSIARYVRPDDSESDNLYLLAPPAGTPLLDPPIIAGRELCPGEANAILVSPGLLANEPTLCLGGPMNLKIEGLEKTYTIVGVMNMLGNSSIGYFTIVDYFAYTRHVREPNRANAVILTFNAESTSEQQAIASAVEKRFDHARIEVISNFLISEEREEINAAFAVIVSLLMIMIILLATVGGLGLMGTMNLNVMERVREIGVMRAFGASSKRSRASSSSKVS